MMGHNRTLHLITFTLLVIGGINWGLLALFHTDIGTWLGGMDSTIAKVIYILVALSAIYEAATHMMRCKDCKNEMPGKM